MHLLMNNSEENRVLSTYGSVLLLLISFRVDHLNSRLRNKIIVFQDIIRFNFLLESYSISLCKLMMGRVSQLFIMLSKYEATKQSGKVQNLASYGFACSHKRCMVSNELTNIVEPLLLPLQDKNNDIYIKSFFF